VSLSKPRTQNRRQKGEPVTFETVRQLALALPGVEEGKSYGNPAFRVGGKFLARLREEDEIAIRVEFATREVLMGTDPETFYISEHYLRYPAMLIRLSRVDQDDLRRLLEEAWRGNASKRLLAEFEERSDR
jgi:hypothetical protein